MTMENTRQMKESVKALKGAATSLFCGGALIGMALGVGQADAALAGLAVGAVFVGVAVWRIVTASRAIDFCLAEQSALAAAANDASV